MECVAERQKNRKLTIIKEGAREGAMVMIFDSKLCCSETDSCEKTSTSTCCFWMLVLSKKYRCAGVNLIS